MLCAMTPKETMQSYFTHWNDGAFDELQALFADDVDFAGPMGTARGPQECRRGLEGVASMTTDRRVITMLAEGDEVITWFELHAEGIAPIPVANRATVGQDGRIRRIRVAFDPRALLG